MTPQLHNDGIDWLGLQQAGWQGACEMEARQPGKLGLTPLLFAVDESEAHEHLPALISAGADVHARCLHGDSALSYSMTQQFFPGIAIQLLDAGARWTHEDFEHAAQVGRDQEFLALLVQRGVVNRGGRGDTLSPLTPCMDQEDLSLQYHRFREPTSEYSDARPLRDRPCYEDVHRAWVMLQHDQDAPQLGQVIEWLGTTASGERKVLVRWYDLVLLDSETDIFVDFLHPKATNDTDALPEGTLVPINPFDDAFFGFWQSLNDQITLNTAVPAATASRVDRARL